MASAVSLRTWTAITGSTLGAFMAILNIQVVNASLADIRGAIGAGIDDGAWITTAYLIAEIVAIPLAGWLAKVFSTRRYLIASAALFLLFSVACAFAQNLGQMIVLRALQGFFGGVLIPLSFTLIITLLPPGRQPVGMAMFAFAATLAPVIGPTIGGVLSESWGWQSIFYLNLVPGAAMLAMLWLSLEREPMQLDLLRRGDWAGIVTVAIGLGAAQTVLEEGEKLDWLDSALVARLAIVAVLSLGLFIWIELTTAHPLVNLRLLGRRNFLGGALATFLLGLVSYGTVFILPTYLAQVQGYNAQQIGMVLAWTGLPQLLVIPLVPWLMRTVDARWIIVAGLGVFAASNFMNVAISTDLAGDQLLLPNVVRAIGQALVMTPLATLAVVGIEAGDKASASALLSVLRNLGGAFGIAVLQTFLIRREHFHSSMLAQSVSLFDEATRQRLDQLVHYFQGHGAVDYATAWRRAVVAIGSSVHRQAYTLAFGDVFLVLGVILLVAILAALLLKKPASAAAR
jgi:MFS transporter, DHA2 family, multidrug resistance protein